MEKRNENKGGKPGWGERKSKSEGETNLFYTFFCNELSSITILILTVSHMQNLLQPVAV